MSIEVQLSSLQVSLAGMVENETAAPAATVRQWLSEISEIGVQFGEMNSAVQRIANVNAALALMTQLLDAAHTERFDADKIFCLIDPLREKLDRAVDEMQLAI